MTIFRIYIDVYISKEENTHISKILYIEFSFTKKKSIAKKVISKNLR